MDGGCYRRRIRLAATAPGIVSAVMEDDLHHFAVRIGHSDSHIDTVEGQTRRAPWTTCSGAEDTLRDLVGRPLLEDVTAFVAGVDGRMHCLHMLDLVALGSAHAAAGRDHRRYDITVPDGRAHVEVERDECAVLRVDLEDMIVTGPAPFTGVHLRTPVDAWPGTASDPDLLEAVFVLRRASLVSLGRVMDLDLLDRASDIPGMIGTCHTFLAERAEFALRVKGSTRDWSDGPEGMAVPLP